MTANTARRFRTAIMIMMVCIPVAFAYEFISDGRISVIGLVIGIALAMPLALLEESTFDERMRRLLFSIALMAKSLTAGFVLYAIIVFFRQLDRILSPGVLVSYLLGRYHRPHREARIFMFLDLKSSTSLAEELGHEAYLGLVNAFFRDISGPAADLLERLDLPVEWTTEAMGPVTLRGKAEPMELVAYA